MSSRDPRVFVLLTISILVISTAAVLIKLARAPAIIIAAYRLGIAGLFVTTGALWFRRDQLKQLGRREWLYTFLSGFFLALHFLLWIQSLDYTSVASSVVLVTTNPIFVALGTVFFLDERLHTLLIWGIVFSVSGGILIGLGDLQISDSALFGDALALLGAMAHSGYLLIGRRIRARTELWTYIAVVYGTAALVLVIWATLSSHEFLGYSRRTYLILIALALGPQLIGHSIYNWALRYVSAATVAVMILGEPLGASLLAYVFLGETLSVWKIAGGILVLFGIYLATRAEQKMSLRS